MSETVEVMKCHNQNKDIPMCRECVRSGVSKDNEYEVFDLRKNAVNNWVCNGYENVKQGSLF